jgi:hypothetical protein
METTIWSNKYEKWISLETEVHPLNDNLVRFGKNYWYNYKKDMLIHISVINEYVGNTKFKNKQYKAEYWVNKFHSQNQKRSELGLIMEELEHKIDELGLPVNFIKNNLKKSKRDFKKVIYTYDLNC